MNENCNAGTNAAQKHKRARVIIPIVCAVLILAAVAVACAVFMRREEASPLEKTLRALISDEMVPMDKLNREAAGFTLTLGRDVLGDAAKVPLKIRGSTVRSGGMKGLSLDFGTDNNTLDGQVLLSDDTVYLSSDSLLGDTAYSVTLTEAALRASFLNPERGGEYALPEEQFEALCKFVSKLESRNSKGGAASDAEESLSGTAKRLGEVFKNNLRLEKENRSVELIDGEHKCQVVTYTLDNDGFTQLMTTLKKEIEVYDLEKNLKKYLFDGILDETSGDTAASDVSISAIVDEMLKDGAPELKLTVSGAMLGGYLVCADVNFSVTDKAGGEVPGELSTAVRFTSKPASDRRARATVSIMRSGKKTLDATIDYSNDKVGSIGRKESFKAVIDMLSKDETTGALAYVRVMALGTMERDDNGAFMADLEGSVGVPADSDEQLQPVIKLHAAGSQTWDKREKCLTFRLSALSLTAAQEKVLDMKESSLVITLGGKPRKVELSQTVELLELTDDGVKQLGAQLGERFDSQFSRLAEESGLWKRTKKYTQTAKLSLNKAVSPDAVAWDRTTDRIYIVENVRVGKTAIKAYSAPSGELLCERVVSGNIVSIDADGGYVAMSKQEYPFKAYVLDGATFADERTLAPEIFASQDCDYLTNVIIDGDDLICSTSDQHTNLIVANWRDGQYEVMFPHSYQCAMAYDREHRIYAMLDRGISRTSMTFYSLDRKVFYGVEVMDSYSYGTVYFDGTSFQGGGKYYSYEGKMLKRGSIVPKRPYDPNVADYGIVYSDANMFMLQNLYVDNTYGTVAYSQDGAPIAFPGELVISRFFGQNGEYAVMRNEDAYSQNRDEAYVSSLVICRIEDAWCLNGK